jgi:hypothetical protein
MYVCVCMYVW